MKKRPVVMHVQYVRLDSCVHLTRAARVKMAQSLLLTGRQTDLAAGLHTTAPNDPALPRPLTVAAGHTLSEKSRRDRDVVTQTLRHWSLIPNLAHSNLALHVTNQLSQALQIKFIVLLFLLLEVLFACF